MTTRRMFKATTGFNCPATPEDLAKAKADHTDPTIVWKRVEKGAKLPDPGPELLKSWRANKCVKEVKQRG